MTRIYCKKCNSMRNFYPEHPSSENSPYKKDLNKILCWKGFCNHTYSSKEIKKYTITMRYFLQDGTELTFPKPQAGSIKLIPPPKR